jgi:hypothetical protein
MEQINIHLNNMNREDDAFQSSSWKPLTKNLKE